MILTLQQKFRLFRMQYCFAPKRQPATIAVTLFTRDFQRVKNNKIESYGFNQIFDRVRSSTGANVTGIDKFEDLKFVKHFTDKTL